MVQTVTLPQHCYREHLYGFASMRISVQNVDILSIKYMSTATHTINPNAHTYVFTESQFLASSCIHEHNDSGFYTGTFTFTHTLTRRDESSVSQVIFPGQTEREREREKHLSFPQFTPEVSTSFISQCQLGDTSFV